MSVQLFKSSLLVGAWTLVSRLLGLVRDIVMAHLLGAGALNDAFVLANRIPNFLRRLFAEGAFSQAFVPILAQVQAQHGDDGVRLLVAKAAGTLGVLISLVTVAGIVTAPLLMILFAPGWFIESMNQEDVTSQYSQATFLLQLVFPYLWFITLAALGGAVLNLYNRFSVAAFSPVFFNAAVIAAAIGLSPHTENPAVAIAVGVSVGGLCQFLWLLPFLKSIGLLEKPRWAWRDKQMLQVRTLMLPALFGVSVAQISMLLSSIIASFLQVGSLSWLTYADRLFEFPLGIFGLAIATVILPGLSHQIAVDDKKSFNQSLNWAVCLICITGLPSMTGLFLLAEPLMLTLFQSGNFTVQDAHASSLSLVALSVGLVPLMLVKVFATAFYARQDIRTPVRIGLISICITMLCNLLLAPLLGYIGLAIATAVSACFNAGILGWMLYHQSICTPSRTTLLLILKSSIACVLMAFGLFWLLPELTLWQQSPWQWRAQKLALMIGLATLIYAVTLFLLGCRPRHLMGQTH